MDEDYSPERIQWYLAHWSDLRAAAEGGTGSLAGRGAGRGDRLALACVLADLERAADGLPLHWTATLQVFRAQGRSRIWADRRLLLEEQPVDAALKRMAAALGWKNG